MRSSPEQMKIKRSLLLCARMRMTAPGASIREQAIEKVIEQNLAAADAPGGLMDVELCKIYDLGDDSPSLRIADVREGLKALRRQGRLVLKPTTEGDRFALSESVLAEVNSIIEKADTLFESAVSKLFGSAPGGLEKYRPAFMRSLCLVFSSLGNEYARVIAGAEAIESFLGHQMLDDAISEAIDQHGVPDVDAFKRGVMEFFGDSSPDFTAIKWNYAQNYYLFKVLGLDESSFILSREMLGGATFYLDTNVLVAGLVPQDRNHGGFRELVNACRAIGIKLVISRATQVEFEHVMQHNARELRAVFPRIPTGLLKKVRNFLLEAYLIALDGEPELDVDTFLERFRGPIKQLKGTFGLEVVDDGWFVREQETEATQGLAKKIKATFRKQWRRRKKTDASSLHDALLLRWTQKVSDEDSEKIWILTLDRTLRSYAGHISPPPVVVSLDAILQWATPLNIESVDSDKLAEMYSRALTFQLLPRETFLDTKDFKIFAEMDLETSLLPEEDVEACVVELKNSVPEIDPSNPKDRERAARIIQRFFADPGTRYQSDLEQLRRQLVAQSEAHGSEVEKLQSRLSRVRKGAAGRSATIQSEKDTLGAELDASKERERILKEVIVRGAISLILYVVTFFSILIASYFYSEGNSYYMKLLNSIPLFSWCFGVVTTGSYILLGNKRIKVLYREYFGGRESP